MKLESLRFAAATCVLLGLSATARADMLGPPLLESTTLVGGPSLSVTSLQISGPGTLQVLLTDLKWPEMAQTLSFALSESTGVLGKLDSPGVLSYAVTGPATLFASVYAVPSATATAALYYLKVSFVAAAPVPLPAALWLLTSGMGGLLALGHRRRANRSR